MQRLLRWAHYFHWMNTYPKNASASDESIGLKPRRAYMFQEPNQYSISLVTCWHELQNITELIHRNHQIGNLRSCLVIVACAVVPVLIKHCNVSQKLAAKVNRYVHTIIVWSIRWLVQHAAGVDNSHTEKWPDWCAELFQNKYSIQQLTLPFVTYSGSCCKILDKQLHTKFHWRPHVQPAAGTREIKCLCLQRFCLYKRQNVWSSLQMWKDWERRLVRRGRVDDSCTVAH